jgi:WhiB family redox-sensing transcriptional regulator
LTTASGDITVDRGADEGAGHEDEADVMSWLDTAACRDADPELFFPVGTAGPDVVAGLRALAICRRCDVRQQCLAWAIEQQVTYGIWGGLTEQQRERLARTAASA